MDGSGVRLCRTRRRRAADAAASPGAITFSNALAALAAASVWVWALQEARECFLVAAGRDRGRLLRYDAGFFRDQRLLQLEPWRLRR